MVVVIPAFVVVTVTYTVVASGSTGTIVMPTMEVEFVLKDEIALVVVSGALEGDPVTTVGKAEYPVL